MTHPVLRGPRVVLRPIGQADRPKIRSILAEPEVSPWWAAAGIDATTDSLFEDDDEVVLAIDVAGRLLGCIQYWEEPDPDYRHASIDIFLTASAHGRGLGSEAVRTLARYLFDERGHHRLTIDPAAGNERAIRSYARVGFRPVGVMREYERGADGTWHDALLMDLLKGETVDE